VTGDDQPAADPQQNRQRLAAETSCSSCLTRRSFVGLAGALSLVALPGCTVYEQTGAVRAAPANTPTVGTALAKTSEIPVGGGKILPEANVVITQPTAGSFKGLSATCTHAGCQVSQVADGTISCLCHGSQFGLDGSVKHGPAAAPLPPVAVRVSGSDITLG
jgi:Rieske Fe-S protein